MDVTTVLKEQHREIKRAFGRAALPGRGRDEAFRRLVRMLATHEAAEQAHVHPTVRRAGRGDGPGGAGRLPRRRGLGRRTWPSGSWCGCRK